MQRFYNFIVVFFLLTTNWLSASGQSAPSRSINSTTTIMGKKVTSSLLSEAKLKSVYRYTSPSMKPSSAWSYNGLPSDYYLKMLGFVCKAEYSVEKKLNLPLALRIRAGSLDYVNKMEGKK